MHSVADIQSVQTAHSAQSVALNLVHFVFVSIFGQRKNFWIA